MDIAEVKQRKKQLERMLLSAIQTFEEETGLVVRNIDLIPRAAYDLGGVQESTAALFMKIEVT